MSDPNREKKGIVRVCEKGEELSEDQKYRFYDNRFEYTGPNYTLSPV